MRKISIAIIALCAVFGTSTLVHAASPLTGWAWSSNIGWISFNSADTGTGDGGTGTSPIAYKVQLETNGNLSGYAWSPVIGWISFNGSDLTGCPGTEQIAVNKTSGSVTGWIRAIAGVGRTDGWDGCIKVSDPGVFQTGVPDGTRGVTYVEDVINQLPGQQELPGGSGDDSAALAAGRFLALQEGNATVNAYFKGFAWGGDVIGWLRFNPTASTQVTVGNPSGNNSISGSCTLNTSSVVVGSPVTATLGATTGGTPPYTYSWNAGGTANIATPTAASTNITYSTAGSYVPVVTVTGASGSGSIACPLVTVTTDLDLRIGATGASAALTSYTARRGDNFGLKWTRSLPAGYTCTPIAPSTGTWSDWTSADTSSDGNLTMKVPTGAQLGANTFTLNCNKAANPSRAANVILNVRSSSLEEI